MKTDGRLAVVFLHRRCPGVRSFSSVRRSRGNLAIHCQEKMKTDGRLAVVFLHRRCPGVRSFSSVRRSRGNLAIHCQEKMKTDGRLGFDGPGAEAPDSGRS
jgi:hypothetical protein